MQLHVLSNHTDKAVITEKKGANYGRNDKITRVVTLLVESRRIVSNSEMAIAIVYPRLGLCCLLKQLTS